MASFILNSKVFEYDSFLHFKYYADGIFLLKAGALKAALLTQKNIVKINKMTSEKFEYDYASNDWISKGYNDNAVICRRNHGSLIYNTYYVNGKRINTSRELLKAISNNEKVVRRNKETKISHIYDYGSQQWILSDDI